MAQRVEKQLIFFLVYTCAIRKSPNNKKVIYFIILVIDFYSAKHLINIKNEVLNSKFIK